MTKNLVIQSEYTYKVGEVVYEQLEKAGATSAVIADDELALGVTKCSFRSWDKCT